MKAESVAISGLEKVWWGSVVLATLGSTWLLLQVVFVIAVADNVPQATIALAVSLLIVGLPTFGIAVGCLIYALLHRPSTSNAKAADRWRVALAVSAVDAFVPVLGLLVVLAVKFTRDI